MKEDHPMRPQDSFLNDKRGAIAPITIVMLVAFFALLAIVVDVGHLMLVRTQLQDAADAGALAGADALISATGPNWAAGQAAALAAVQKNKADTQQLSTATVQTGYWDTTWSPTTAPASLLSTGIVPGPTDVPAVKVSVQKIGGSNSGPVSLTFGQIFGLSTVNVGAHAIAVVSYPSTVPPGDLFPIALPNSILTSSVYTSPGIGNQFIIVSSYHSTPAGAGQWTTFGLGSQSDSVANGLEQTGNPATVSINGQIWIQSGTKANLFADANAYAGNAVLIPVVATADIADVTGAWETVVGYLPFIITAGVGGSGKYVKGYITGGIIAPGSVGGPPGPNYGVYTPPYLVQ
jgi:Flp pilus assembly protein TadG